ncbi:MAG: OmpA family protein [Flammeovirgaceae bacterium]|nr:OmpA family protein [Flammeovirgaceae bacterium]
MKNKVYLFCLFFLGNISGLIGQEHIILDNIGEKVNSELRELAPIVSPDGKSLYYMIYGHGENKGKADIWVSSLEDKDGNWSSKKRLPFPFNQIAYNQVMSVTPDGNTLMVRGIVENGEVFPKGYSLIKKTKDGWNAPKKMEIAHYDEMNHGVMYSSCLSNNGKILILSFREEKLSNDLYVSFLEENGTWSKPQSLGVDINTFSIEFSPFLASDNRTLYFTSDRKGGKGGYDIYVSKKKGDDWTNWTEPQNVGQPVNTEGNEMYYSLSASGEYAFIASTQNRANDYDIFKVKIKEEQKPDPVVIVYGKVLNGKTGESLEASIHFETFPDGKEAGIAQTDPKTGEYKIVLPYGKDYGFNAKASNFIAISDHLDLSKTADYQEIRRDLKLLPLEIGTTVRLNNIFFETGNSALKEASFSELKKVVKLLEENPKMKIEISGHTDNVGSEESNLKLSEERSEAVTSYLKSQNIVSDRIVNKGYGETKPLSDNNTEEGKQQNRRVDFTILEN